MARPELTRRKWRFSIPLSDEHCIFRGSHTILTSKLSIEALNRQFQYRRAPGGYLGHLAADGRGVRVIELEPPVLAADPMSDYLQEREGETGSMC